MAVCGLCLFSHVNGHTAGAYPPTLYHISSGVHVDNMMAAHASLEPSFFSFHLEMWNKFCFSVQDQWETRLTKDIDAFNEARKLLHLLPPSRITIEMRLHLLRVGEALFMDSEQPVLQCDNSKMASGFGVRRYLPASAP